MKHIPVLFMCLWCSLSATSAGAHSQSNSLLNLALNDTSLQGTWRIALLDLAPVITLDGNLDRDLSWGEIQAQEAAIKAYALNRLAVSRGQRQCTLESGNLQLEQLNSGVYLYLPLAGTCAESGMLEISYSLLFDVDASHRGLLSLQLDNAGSSAVFSPERGTYSATGRPAAAFDTLWQFLLQGVWHIWLGFDHLLFLIALILPLFLHREHHQWVVSGSAGKIRLDVLKTVTAFTIAHSITLVYATLNDVSVSAQFIETFIALSVALSGINILYPVFRGLHWQVAFSFGLIHGFGFAGALSDLSLPTSQFISSLLSFNLGVELGQLVIVLLLFPVLYMLRRQRAYQRIGMPLLALSIMLTGSLWAYDRAAFLWS